MTTAEEAFERALKRRNQVENLVDVIKAVMQRQEQKFNETKALLARAEEGLKVSQEVLDKARRKLYET